MGGPESIPARTDRCSCRGTRLVPRLLPLGARTWRFGWLGTCIIVLYNDVGREREATPMEMVHDSTAVYMIYIDGVPPDRAFMLQKLRQEEFMGIRCLAGTYIVDRGPHFMNGQRTYIPVDKVSFIAEFESHDAYKAAVKLHR